MAPGSEQVPGEPESAPDGDTKRRFSALCDVACALFVVALVRLRRTIVWAAWNPRTWRRG